MHAVRLPKCLVAKHFPFDVISYNGMASFRFRVPTTVDDNMLVLQGVGYFKG